MNEFKRMVVIDGEEYVPVATVVSDATMVALGQAYALAFGYAVYDPACRPECLAQKKLREIYDLLAAANRELHFKR